ncbi:ABC transporter ATP-binding protein [Candidatus Woesearchaeota archaeon]|nr:ABC transporter ATP-binding protein [Candidatus Woesearchaeota archaeon]
MINLDSSPESQRLPVILFEHVTKKLGNKDILKDISFQIFPGETFGIIGPSGSGKTTLLRTLIGFYGADKGKIYYQQRDITTNLKMIRQLFGFASQENCFYDELSCVQNLKYFGTLYGLTDEVIKSNSHDLLSLVGLLDMSDELARNLSGGMKRRLDVACALMHNPKVLIMDEPTVGLDPVLRKSMWHVIKAIAQHGTTIILTSHLMDEIEHLCNGVAMISAGRLLAVGSPNRLKEMYSSNEEIQLESFPGRYNALLQQLYEQKMPISFFVNRGSRLVIYTKQAETVLHAILHLLEKSGEKLLDVDVNKPNLDEVFEAFARMGEKK